MNITSPASADIIFTESINSISGLGPKTKSTAALNKIGIFTIADLLFHFPTSYTDRTNIIHIGDLTPLYEGTEVTISGIITSTKLDSRPRGSIFQVTLSDGTGYIRLSFFNFKKFQQDALRINTEITIYGRLSFFNNQPQLANPEFLSPNENSESLTPSYALTAGIKQQAMRRYIKQALDFLSAHDVPEYLPTALNRYHLTLKEALQLVHQPPKNTDLQVLARFETPAQARVIIEELTAHNLALRAVKQKSRQYDALPLSTPSSMVDDFEKNLPFKLTKAQRRAFTDISKDLSQNIPMTRLVQGDVGCGKTMVAILSALTAALSNCQAAVMVPTEILAQQHYKDFVKYLEPFGVQVGLLTGKMKAKEKQALQEDILSGEVKVIIGTHALIQNEVIYHRLALVIIDEQHRFGVRQRMALRQKACDSTGFIPHILSMTATPIPRTLAQTAFADMDISIIDELPPNRQPIITIVHPISMRDTIIAHIEKHVAEGKQVYWVCCLINESEVIDCQDAINTASYIAQVLPQRRIGLLHGQMKAPEKQEIMDEFNHGNIDILVATSVIEVGVNNPNAFLIVIENAERHGLAQLHQLRGRVGRGKLASFCCLLHADNLSLTGRQRLKVLEQSSNGFYIAEQDMQFRGPGDLLGTQQTGELNFRVANMLRDTKIINEASADADIIEQQYPEAMQNLIDRWYRTGEELSGN